MGTFTGHPWGPSLATTGDFRTATDSYRTDCAWRDVPDTYAPWKTLWKRHARFSRDGTWDRIHQQLLAEADAAGQIDWQLSIDSTISRVHQHGASLSREAVATLPSHTGGWVELQETAGRAG